MYIYDSYHSHSIDMMDAGRYMLMMEYMEDLGSVSWLIFRGLQSCSLPVFWNTSVNCVYNCIFKSNFISINVLETNYDEFPKHEFQNHRDCNHY